MTVHVNGGDGDLQAQIERLKAENAKLRAGQNGKLTLKVSKQGAVSVYGMGKWPVTLYSQQWARVLGAKDQIEAFISANADSLSVKGE